MATHCRARRAIRPNRQVAVLLIQERVKAFVVGWRQAEHGEQCAIASARVLETSMDQRREIVSRQLVRLERLMHHRPEVLASDQPLPQSVGGPGTAVEAARDGCRFLAESGTGVTRRRNGIAAASNLRREIVRRDRPVPFPYYQTLCQVLQLAHVAGPGIHAEQL